MGNNKLTHGLLIESFKQSLMSLLSQNPLDIQSKAVVFDYINIQLQKLSDSQTKKELEEYQAEQESLNQRTPKNSDTNNTEAAPDTESEGS